MTNNNIFPNIGFVYFDCCTIHYTIWFLWTLTVCNHLILKTDKNNNICANTQEVPMTQPETVLFVEKKP